MNELTLVTIETIKKNIEVLGAKSKELCKNIYLYLTAFTDDKDARTRLMNECNLSKQSITQMYKAGDLYNRYTALENMSHTNIVELAPIEKVDTIEHATIQILGVGDLTEWENYTQKEIRELVKNYITDIDTDTDTDTDTDSDTDTDTDIIDVTKDEIKNFINYLIDEYNIDREDANTLKYYASIK